MIDKNFSMSFQNNLDQIIIKGAEQNNLKKIDLNIPKNKLVVITGISGSGKSSLAMDTIYLEGYRRYVENLSSSARLFLKMVKKTKVKKIINLSPTIAVSQKKSNFNPRSTVGTLSDIYDFLRVLMAEASFPVCPQCGEIMIRNNQDEIVDRIKNLSKGEWVIILAAFDFQKNAKDNLVQANQMGFVRVRVNGKVKKINELNFEKIKPQSRVEIVVDRFLFSSQSFDWERVIDSLQTALKLSFDKKARVVLGNREEISFCLFYICPSCQEKIENFSAKHFSFNLPEGACEECKGLGEIFEVDPEKIIPNKKLSLVEGAIFPWSRSGKFSVNGNGFKLLKKLSLKYHFSLKKPFEKLPSKIQQLIFEGESLENNLSNKGEKPFEGVLNEIRRRYQESTNENQRLELEKYFRREMCPSCEGFRLKKKFLAFKFGDKNLKQLLSLEINDLVEFFKESKSWTKEKIRNFQVAQKLINEILERLENILKVGLGYLDLNRSVNSLSGGEFQRLRLSNQIYSGLSNIIYVLDEPSVGLHSRDTEKLIKILLELKSKGNSLIVVEHDKDIIRKADYIIDMGPGAGEEGGEVIFKGTLQQLKKAKTETSRYIFSSLKNSLSFSKKVEKNIDFSKDNFIEIKGATKNNLKNIDIKIPLEKLVAVVGVSGSGKTSLIIDILADAFNSATKKNKGKIKGKKDFKEILGLERVSQIISIDQQPIGRSNRSNAATYTGVFSYIRKLFAETNLAKKMGFSASYFSFNMRGGRCEYCQGEGRQKVEMYLLEDVYTECQFCNGTRYNSKILQVQYHGVNIVDVLNMSVDYAFHFFYHQANIREKLNAMRKVGLGYLKLGQSAMDLSGGESQRIKLATDLARKSNEKTVYIFDEPTIGLHLSDIDKLLKVFRELTKNGSSVIVIEHNLDVVRNCDWVIELGPEGGKKGGEVVFEGTPFDLIKANTWTGKFLKNY